MKQFVMTAVHFQLQPGDLMTFVTESSTRFWGVQELILRDAKGDLWTVPVDKFKEK